MTGQRETPGTRPNVLLILVDALRYDVVSDDTLRRALLPNIDSLVGNGGVTRIISLASNTQFVMPSFLTGTRPLDYGGHNSGCKGRPAGIAEQLRDHGYRTAVFSNCVLYNRNLGFDRGFEQAVVAGSSRLSLMQDIEYSLLTPIRCWREGQISDAEIVALLRRDYGAILDHLIEACGDPERAPAAIPRARRMNAVLCRDARRERTLLATEPLAVAAKLASVPEIYYHAVLGRRTPGARLLWLRIANKLYRAATGAIGRIGWLRALRMGHIDSLMPLFEEMQAAVDRFIRGADRPWFAFIHVMDAHTYAVCADQIARCPAALVRRLRRLPRIRRLCRERGYGYIPLYLANLVALDTEIGRLLRTLIETGQRGNTLIMLTSDHGMTQPGADGRPTPDLPRRFFQADLEVPLVADRLATATAPTGLHDSRDVGATLLSMAGIASPVGLEGMPIGFGPGRDVVVSENAGRGFCDLSRDDLNFVVTSSRDKLFAVLRGEELAVTDYYDLDADPGETRNLAGQPEAADRAAALLAALWRERGALLRRRSAVDAAEGLHPEAGTGPALVVCR